jgi:acetyl-CoA decarbonylase/synthase complex subunit gamma
MANALELYKLLPKTNCGDCGYQTCLAFAMRLASAKVKPEECPHLSDEAKATLLGDAAPPVKDVEIGQGGNPSSITIGGELVFYRHEKKFVNETGFCIAIHDTDSREIIDQKLKEKSMTRLAQKLATNMIAIFNSSGNVEPFISCIKKVIEDSSYPLILYSKKTTCLEKAIEVTAGRRPLVGPVTEENFQQLKPLLKSHACPVIISISDKTPSYLETNPFFRRVTGAGIADIVLDCSGKTALETLHNLVTLRWKAVKEEKKEYGYPTICFPSRFSNGQSLQEITLAGLMSIKYGSIVVLEDYNLNHLIPLFVLRQNIFTDPQKPIQVTPKLYSIGDVTESSPVFLTTNFSLTYFIVSNDIESSEVPSYLLIVDTEGTSVLTAYAADKINASIIKKSFEATQLEEKVSHRKIIIPGYLSPLSAKIEEETGWDILVGPTDSGDIASYLEQKWRSN